MKRQNWIRGPDIPNDFHDVPTKQRGLCSAAINSTSMVLIGGPQETVKVKVFDFIHKIWKNYPGKDVRTLGLVH